MVNAKKALMDYGLSIIAPFVIPKISDLPTANAVFEKYEEAINNPLLKPEDCLTSILSQVHLQGRDAVDPVYIQPGMLKLKDSAFVPTPEPITKTPSVTAFDYQLLVEHAQKNNFTLFYFLFLRIAWSLPCTIKMKGVSLFDQWKTIAAMTFASGDYALISPAKEFLLVGGDIPGIQNFVYTITSKGATKGLRGRSFFIQLIGNAIVHRLLDEWDLTETNIIYAAGGNFMILAPAFVKLMQLKTTFEHVMLKYFHGELGLCLDGQLIGLKDLSRNVFSDSSRLLKEKIASQKRTRFSALAVSDWEQIFAPQGKPGNQFCAICQTPLGEEEGEPIYENTDSQDKRCPVCATFEALAGEIRKANFEVRSRKGPSEQNLWQKILFELSGFTFSYLETLSKKEPDSTVLAINKPDFNPTEVDGFKFIANTTPVVTKDDIADWEKDHDPEEKKPKEGDIRTFSQLAKASQGLTRLGVLRMDVDNLGQVMVSGLANRNILTISCLSRTLDWFFEGWLNVISAQVEQPSSVNGDTERLYIIYSGGDDLFIVGCWDLLPILAHRIHSDFQVYSGFNPSLTISAGIVLEPGKYPLYQAARDAGEAEEAAKDIVSAVSEKFVHKNAFSFLGQTFPWADFEMIEKMMKRIAKIARDGNKSLIRILLNIYQQYLESVKIEETPMDMLQQRIPYGPWMWRSLYSLTRLASREGQKKEELKQDILTMQEEILKTPNHFGLAARWAELLIRKEEQ